MEAAAVAVVLEFVATHVSPLVERARLREVASLVRETFASAAAHFDARLAPVPPHVVSLLTLALVTCCFALFDAASSAKRHLARVGVSSAFFGALRSLPGVEALVARRSSKLLRSLSASKAAGGAGPPRCLALQPAGQPAAAVLEQALALAAADASWTPGECTFSGTVYIPSTEHFVLLNKMYARFAHSNPLHADIFAACARMEREVVAMTASVLGGGPGGSPRVCGVMTSGGTESICTAIRATRDFFGKEQPEMVVAASAHAAVYKAASYFNIRLVKVPVDAAQRMDLAAVRRAVNKHTILVYCSAPGFPHGAVDDVPSLAAIALAAGCGCHVDACLGGFVLPFATAAGHPKLGSQRFDFSVPGVTSMSVDTHKYGLAQKGSSVLLYSSPELRRCQYTAVTDWSGGLYISPGAAGSRPGGLIAQTWASLMHVGRDGFVASARTILDAARMLAHGVSSIPGLAVIGSASDPSMVVAFKSTDRMAPIFVVNDAMRTAGWHLVALQRPPALHFCVTPANAGAVPALIAGLRAAVEGVRSRGGNSGVKGGMAPIYGLAGGVPDRGAVGELLKGVQDAMLDG